MKIGTLAAALLLAGCSAVTQPTAPGPDAALVDTYWTPVEIGGSPVSLHPGTREPHLILRREGSRVTGFTGCNKLAGGFEQDGASLRFGNLAMTRMACVGEAGNKLETAFTQALGATDSYRIGGDTLELRDATGTVRMRLTGRPLQ
jgi:copper homeostasis protein (lipoprotein)